MGRHRRRRRWSVKEKRRIVAETMEPGASVSIVARRHDVNANQVFSWRRWFGAEPQTFVPVVISPEPSPASGLASGEASGTRSDGPPKPSAEMAGRMEIVLGCGSRIVVDHDRPPLGGPG
ncbi:MAG: transposase [Alphaproteobacteria bacterium]